jgi:drug/metabolite transporter (DMT)-like permease
MTHGSVSTGRDKATGGGTGGGRAVGSDAGPGGASGGVDRSPRATRLAVAALCGQTIFLGYNWVVMKVALQYSDPWPFTALRTGLGALSLFALLVILRRDLRLRQPLLTFALGVLQTTLGIGLLVWALETGAAGRVSALVYTMPFWALLFGWIFLGERIFGLQWLAAALSVLGLLLVLDPANLVASLQSKLLAVGAGIGWAASTIVVKKIRQRGPVDVINLTAWQMLLGSIPMVIVALVVPSDPIEWTGTFIAALIYNVIPATAVAWALWLYVLQVLPAGVAGFGTLATPVVGISAAAIQLGEQVSTVEALGIAAILAALLVLTLRGLLLDRATRGLESGQTSGGAGVSGEGAPGGAPERASD